MAGMEENPYKSPAAPSEEHTPTDEGQLKLRLTLSLLGAAATFAFMLVAARIAIVALELSH